MSASRQPEELPADLVRLRHLAAANAFYRDVRYELRVAHDARIANHSARVGLMFEFWRREHPEMMETLPAILEREWRGVQNDIEREIDAFLQVLGDVVLPAIGPIPHAIDNPPLLKASNALYERHQRFAKSPGASDGIGALDMTCPLTVGDFQADFEIEGEGKLYTLIRRFPIIYRGHRNFDRHPSPFSQRGGFECGEGWFGIIRDLSEYLERMAVAMKLSGVEPPIVVQAKEKLGTLSFYVDGVPDAFREDWMTAYQVAIQRSGETCERCGAPGTMRGLAAAGGIGGWVHCYCDTCERQYQDERA